MNHLSDSSLEANRISRIYDNATKTLWMSICRATFWKLNMVDCLRRPASFDQLSDKISRLESLQVDCQNSSFILQDNHLLLEFFETGGPAFCNIFLTFWQVQNMFCLHFSYKFKKLDGAVISLVQLLRQFWCVAAAVLKLSEIKIWMIHRDL